MDPKTIPAHPLLCDFCNDSMVEVRTYDAAPLSMKVQDTVVYFCDSRWAARSLCAQLIDENRWAELTARSYEQWLKMENRGGASPDFKYRQFMKTHLTQLHQLFREARGRTA